ncbi:MAG: carboxypeptidase-like regulatory domain-containing protein [Gammaproteobacteria bacterium]|nr:carboxypeptidase-like regulatory domain-containing protein [Gammaproteobacteria bacterium]
MEAIRIMAILATASATAQQTGRIEGAVVDGGTAVPGVAIVAASAVMPRPRTARTDANGWFTLGELVPGAYRVVLDVPGRGRRTIAADVLLDQATVLTVDLDAWGDAAESVIEEIVVTAERVTSRSGAAIANALGDDVVEGVPLGRDYRDLVKLAPGVQYTQDAVRGPSAGGNGQDNVYRFDGVDVSLPMFGTLSAEPSNHDIDQVTFVRGGVDAVGFNRSGGFAMDSTARSGTDRFEARVEYAAAPRRLVAERPGEAAAVDLPDESWVTLAAGGPLVPSRLFAYGSFYRPVEERANKATAYGPAKDFSNTREEYYGRLTYAPWDNVLVNASYRTSRRDERGVSVGPYEADSVSLGGRAEQDIVSVDGSWVTAAGPRISFRYNDYALRGFALPDLLLSVQPSLGGTLDTARLDEMGHLAVPSRRAGEDAFNAAVAPIIERYGYADATGRRIGGGAVGAHPQIGEQAFYRRGIDLAADHDLAWGRANHALHVGLRRAQARERLRRTSNGWGRIDVPGGVDRAEDGSPIFYVATVQQMSLRQADGTVVAPIVSTTDTTSLEINDAIRYGDFLVNVGVLVSEDVLHGQGLRHSSGTYSGFVTAPGHSYRMYTIRWQDMVQPRLGVTWHWNGSDAVFLNFARYHPAANSLARAASWDRNTRATLRVLFDEAGRIIDHEPLPGSSGKVFQRGLAPRRIDEWTLGATRDLAGGLALRGHLRWRDGSDFWEDTWNGSRGYDSAPARIAAKGLYVPDLDRIRAEIGGSSYVVAALDDAYTDYWEAALELEWRTELWYLNASYVRSRYTGNFDQDNTSAVNDANRFIGSSNLADGYGRQLWDMKDGVLRGDRPHLFKAFGTLDLPWRATAGVFGVYQSGQPWEAWDAVAYGLPSYFSSTIRYAEQAGSRRSPSHWQVDLSYAQDVGFPGRARFFLRFDLFNLFDRQTGYNMNPYVRDANFGAPRNRFDSRRLQVSIRLDV